DGATPQLENVKDDDRRARERADLDQRLERDAREVHGLAKEPAAPEDAEDQLVEGHVDVGAEVADLPRGAEALGLVEVLLEGRAVALEDLGGDGDLALLAGLAVVDADVSAEIGPGLGRIDDVDHE